MAWEDNEATFRVLAETTTSLIFVYQGAKFRYVNPAAEAAIGYTRKELQRMRFWDVVHPDFQELVKQRGQARQQGQQVPGRYEIKILTRAGEERWLDAAVALVDFEGGKAVLGTCFDITERKRAEEGLRESEERYRDLVENVEELICTHDLDGTLLSVNRAVVKHSGFERAEDLVGRNIREFLSPDVRAMIPAYLETVKKKGRARGLMKVRTRSGEERILEYNNTLRSQGLETPIVRGVARDVTERKRADRKLEEQRTYLNALIENSPLAIVASDRERRVQMCNPAFERLFQFGQEETVGKVLDDLIAPAELRGEATEITRRVMAGETLHATSRRQRKDGSLVDVNIYALPLTIKGEHVGSYALYRDITETKVLEAQLRQAQKMEAVGRLAGGVAHDFNNLLMVMRGNTELVLNRAGSDETLRRQVEEIQHAADRATSLTQQLLAFSRKQILKPEVLDLNAVVADTEKMLRRLIGEDVELVTALAPTLSHVKADPGQVEQIILNLAVNARDAMPRGGKLVIETANVKLTNSFARRHPGATPGPHAMLAVSDTGCGMDEVTQSHIFEPFFTTKGQGKGTGLGLATVYGIVKQSGGYIWVNSELGRGTTFEIYLARVEARAEPAPQSRTLPELPRGSETVLLVEDEEAVRRVMREFLEGSGYTVLEAKDCAQALQIGKEHAGPIHLIVSDVVMPCMSGPELAAHLRSFRPELRVLYISGYTEGSALEHGVPDDGASFLQKPFSLDALARRVFDVLQVETGNGRTEKRLPTARS